MSSRETYPIVGVQAGHGPKPGQVPLRIEVDDFFSDPNRAIQLDLLYLALAKFQDLPYNDKLSYFQVSGIHGFPLVTWDDPTKPFGTSRSIYCEHGTVIFGTWHRPYVSLFEQRLYEIMINQIIPLYPQAAQETLKKEADQFRLPYWDWAVKKHRTQDGKEVLVYDLPLIVKAEKVQVSTPSGGLKTIDNPFYNFRTEKNMGEYGIIPISISRDPKVPKIPFNRATATSRHPPDPRGNPANLAAFSRGVQNNRASAKEINEADFSPVETETWSLQDAVYRLLSPGYSETYTDFITIVDDSPARNDPKRYLSLEGIHNNLHVWTGGRFGHMAHVPVAAFDPIFYLHHCNIDRLLAIWQSANPDKWFEEQTLGRKITPKTPLEPFHSDKAGTLYTSESSRNHFNFGYSYPELQRWNFESDKEYIAHVNKEVERLYGPSATTQLRLAHHDAVVNVSFEKFALNGLPFTVNVFLEGELIGQVENFAFASEEQLEDGTAACENCRQQRESGVHVTGQVFATKALIKATEDPNNTELKVLDRDSISAYLKKHLSWKVTLRTGEEVEIPSLQVVPALGRRNVNLLAEPEGNTRGPVVNKPGARRAAKRTLKSGVVELPSITPEVILDTKASYGNNGIIEVRDNHNPDKVYKLEVAGWGAYESIF